MDIAKALHQLYAERARLDRAVARLEAMVRKSSTVQKSNRGRKSMPPEERLLVSRRITEYWAARRQGKAKEIEAASEDG